MNMKRFLVLGILGMFLVSMMGLVLGEDLSGEAGAIAESGVTWAGGFFGTLLAPLFGDQEMLSRVFFALLLGMIIFSIISVMFGTSSRTMQWTITGIITSLSLLGLPAGFLEAIRTQYGAMGATILTIIPFIIILTFSLRTRSILVARVTWIFYSFYYLAMYLSLIFAKSSGGWITSETIPYIGGFFAGIFIFAGVGNIRRLLRKGEIQGLLERGKTKVKTRAALQKIQDEDLGRYNISG